MLLKDLKRNMLLPKKDVLLNKVVKIRGIDMHLISITMEEHRNVLWAIYTLPDYFDSEMDIEKIKAYDSNRSQMTDRAKKHDFSTHIHIHEMIIQDQKMTFPSSSVSHICDMHYEGYMQLQHFIEKGMDTTDLEKINISNLYIAAYEQAEDERFPTIDLSKELDMTLKVRKEFKQILINQPMQDKGTCRTRGQVPWLVPIRRGGHSCKLTR